MVDRFAGITTGNEDDHTRWVNALDRLVACFVEIGYKAEIYVVYGEDRAGITFTHPVPPYDLILRAGELCGVRDLVELALGHVKEQNV